MKTKLKHGQLKAKLLRKCSRRQRKKLLVKRGLGYHMWDVYSGFIKAQLEEPSFLWSLANGERTPDVSRSD